MTPCSDSSLLPILLSVRCRSYVKYTQYRVESSLFIFEPL